MRRPETYLELLDYQPGELISKASLYRLIQYSKEPGSPAWLGDEYRIGNTPQQGINWIGEFPNLKGVIVKSSGSAYDEGWLDETRNYFRYAFKAQRGIVNPQEKANRCLIQQPELGYPIILLIDSAEGWGLEGHFDVDQVQERHVVLKRRTALAPSTRQPDQNAESPPEAESVQFDFGSEELITVKTQARQLAIKLPLSASTYVLRPPLAGSRWREISAQSVRIIAAHTQKPIVEWLPQLASVDHALRDIESLLEDIPRLSTRVQNTLLDQLLLRDPHFSWAQLARLSPAELRSLNGLGENSVDEILEVLVYMGIRPSTIPMSFPEPVSDSQSGSNTGEETSEQTVESADSSDCDAAIAELHTGWVSLWQEVQTIASWARLELPAGTAFFKALELAADPSAPAAINEAAEAINRLAVPRFPAPDMPALIDSLLAELSENQQLVINTRLLSADNLTLHEVSKQLAVTRERIRQIELAAHRRLHKLLTADNYRPLAWRAHTLQHRLGSMFPQGHGAAEAILKEALGDAAERKHVAFMLWLAGPYTLKNGLWGITESSVHAQIHNRLKEMLEPDGATLTEVQSELANIGIQPAFVEEIMMRMPGHQILERYFWRGITMTDRAAVALSQLARPATIAEIAATAAFKTVPPTNIRSRIFEDSRFMRVAKDTFALSEWGLVEYRGIADAIRRSIELAGGLTQTASLLEEIPAKFGVSPASVRTYLDAPMFVHEHPTIRLRTPDEPFTAEDLLHTRQGVFRFGSLVTILVEVDAPRAKGRAEILQPDVVQSLGVNPGESRVFHGPSNVDIPVSWPATSALGGNVGQLRSAIHAAGVAVGETLRLTFDSDRLEVRLGRIISEELERLEPLEAVRHVTGVTFANSSDALEQLDAFLKYPLTGVGPALKVRGDRLTAGLVSRL